MEAFFILVATTSQLSKMGVESDHTTYGTILRACSTLLPPGDIRRKELVDVVFRKACREGRVSRMVLAQMKFAASAAQYREIIGRYIEENVRPKDLPSAWTFRTRDNNTR